MASDRFLALFWAFGLSVATGFVVTSVVQTPTGMSPVTFTFGAVAVSLLALSVLFVSRWEHWTALGGTIGFALYFVSLFVGVVILGVLPRLVLGDLGLLTIAFQLLGSALGFAITVWLCFYGGAWTVLDWLAPRLGIEIRSRNA
ncbi:MAG: hypothetical protein ABEI57_07055 [Halapricum sp.]